VVVRVDGRGGVVVREVWGARGGGGEVERGADGYRLEVLPRREGGAGEAGEVVLTAWSAGGFRAGRATVAQMARASAAEWGGLVPRGEVAGAGVARLPAVVIEDWGAFAVRGVMLDVSRNRVPTMRELLEFVDAIAGMKFNHLQLYTEHTFAYAGHEAAWVGSGAITGDELRRVDAYAAERGVELAANQNCFGHLAHWLRLPAYAHLAETHGDWMFDVWPRSGPFSLSPVHPGSIELVRGWLEELLPSVRSGLVNIGCDETYDVGYGQSAAEVRRRAAERGGVGGVGGGGGDEGLRAARVSVYAEFVNRIAAEVRRLGKRPMFWSDVALSSPGALRTLDPALIALAWGYEGDAPFARTIDAVKESGVPREVWVCPGTGAWRSITGRTAERTANLAAAARCAGRSNAMLVCEWGDVGHRQVWPVTMHALAHAAEAAWRGEADGFVGASGERAAEEAGAAVFGVPGLGPWLQRFGDVDAELRRVGQPLSRPGVPGVLRNATALFADLHLPLNAGLEVGSVEAWEGVSAAIARLGAELAGVARGAREAGEAGGTRGRCGGEMSALVAEELAHAVGVAQLAADRGAAKRRGGGGAKGGGGVGGGAGIGLTAAERRGFAERLRALIAQHERLWLARSRRGGLEESTGHYGRVLAELEE
jgi:hexosaminidase